MNRKKLVKKDERRLLAKLLAGNKRAFREFYNVTKPRLLKWVESRVDNHKDAEEIVQDSFLSLIESLPVFRGKSSLKTFLTSIARHEIADYWRKKYAKKAILTVPFMDQVYTEKLYSSIETSVEVERVFAKLLPEEELILRLKYEDNLSVGEIAKKIGASVKATESKLFRARKAFQFAISKLNF